MTRGDCGWCNGFEENGESHRHSNNYPHHCYEKDCGCPGSSIFTKMRTMVESIVQETIKES